MYKDIWGLMVLILEKFLDKKSRFLDKQREFMQSRRATKVKITSIVFLIFFLINIGVYWMIPGPFFSGLSHKTDHCGTTYFDHSNILFFSKSSRQIRLEHDGTYVVAANSGSENVLHMTVIFMRNIANIDGEMVTKDQMWLMTAAERKAFIEEVTIYQADNQPPRK